MGSRSREHEDTGHTGLTAGAVTAPQELVHVVRAAPTPESPGRRRAGGSGRRQRSREAGAGGREQRHLGGPQGLISTWHVANAQVAGVRAWEGLN